jgi:hypothetical protein
MAYKLKPPREWSKEDRDKYFDRKKSPGGKWMYVRKKQITPPTSGVAKSSGKKLSITAAAAKEYTTKRPTRKR